MVFKGLRLKVCNLRGECRQRGEEFQARAQGHSQHSDGGESENPEGPQDDRGGTVGDTEEKIVVNGK